MVVQAGPAGAAVALPLRGAVGPELLEERASAPAPAELQLLRRRAWELYCSIPRPSPTRDEDWRRTDLSRLSAEEYVAAPGQTGHGERLVSHLRELAQRLAPGSALLANTRNGLRAAEGVDRLAAQGVLIGEVDEIALRHPELVRRALDLVAPVGSTVEHGDAHFLALWNALRVGGCLVYVPPGVEACVPVVAAHSAAGERAAVFPATLAVVEANASLTLIEIHASPASEAPLFSDAVSAVVVGEGARVDHCLLQSWAQGATHVGLSRAALARDARYRCFVASLGGGLGKSYIEVGLDGQGAEASIAGLVFGSGTQHHDHQSLQAHRAANTRSDLLLKVAVRDRARSVYSGLIDVAEGAQKTDGYVQNRNLMLSRGSRATGIPRLEIRADDVRCSHGVTASHIDDDERFYMHTRGIAPADADRLIVRGFMQDALDRCPHPGFAEAVGTLLDEAVSGGSVVGIGSDGEEGVA